jgi:hypothetical protein
LCIGSPPRSSDRCPCGCRPRDVRPERPAYRACARHGRRQSRGRSPPSCAPEFGALELVRPPPVIGHARRPGIARIEIAPRPLPWTDPCPNSKGRACRRFCARSSPGSSHRWKSRPSAMIPRGDRPPYCPRFWGNSKDLMFRYVIDLSCIFILKRGLVGPLTTSLRSE